MKDMQIHGLMLDMSRVTERYEHYLSMAQAASDWGYDTIFAHLTDDDGCGMRFHSRPELASPHALTRQQIEKWIDNARNYGLSIIPEIECFGHTRFIHTLPRYKHLSIRGIGPHNAIHPLHPDTHAVIADLLHETAEVFHAPYIHAGFDEVNLGDGSALGAAARGKANWEIFADYVNHVHGIISGLGKQMMIWGDHLVHEPRIADRISHDITICDWQYHPDVNTSSTHKLIDMGFRVLCCPSSSRSGDMILPRSNTQGNLQRFSRIAHAADDRVIGLVNTIWCPGRMLCDMERFALALGGAWFKDPEADPLPVVCRFVSDRFGIEPPQPVAEAILRLSTLMPHNSLPRRIMRTETSLRGPTPGSITASEAALMHEVALPVHALRSVFEANRNRVQHNAQEYGNVILACDLIDWFDRLADHRLNAANDQTRAKLADEGARLVQRCREDWTRRRFDDDPKRDNDTYAEKDGLITNLTQAVAGLTTQPTSAAGVPVS